MPSQVEEEKFDGEPKPLLSRRSCSHRRFRFIRMTEINGENGGGIGSG